MLILERNSVFNNMNTNDGLKNIKPDNEIKRNSEIVTKLISVNKEQIEKINSNVKKIEKIDNISQNRKLSPRSNIIDKFTEDKSIKNNKNNKNAKIEKKLEQEPISNNIKIESLPLKNEKENDLKQYLSNSLLILEKIQNEFEKSAKNNMSNLELTNRIMKTNLTNLLSNYELFANYHNTESIMKNQNDYFRKNIIQVKHVPDYEKCLVSQQIQNNSESRLSNYKTIFSLIKTTLHDIKINFNDIQSQSERPNHMSASMIESQKPKPPEIKIKERRIETEPCVYEREKILEIMEKSEILEKSLVIDQSEREKITLSIVLPNKETTPMKKRHEFSYCDFSETSMLECAVIIPPKLTGCGFGMDDKPNNYNEEETLIQLSNYLDDRTIIEYDSIVTEDSQNQNQNTTLKQIIFLPETKTDTNNVNKEKM